MRSAWACGAWYRSRPGRGRSVVQIHPTIHRLVFRLLLPLAQQSFALYGGSGSAYQSLGFAGLADATFTGTSSANGTGLETVKTWGFRGGFTHNWDPYWSTSIYGAYAQLKYGDAAKATICNNARALLLLSGNCYPDFNIGV